jgi:ferric-dicitrate binding protein FerR (iron transport regulator)
LHFHLPRLVFGLVTAGLVAQPAFAATASSRRDGRITQIIRDVNLLLANTAPRAAALNEQVHEGIGVRTGSDSRAELTFIDLTIERLGANSLFSFARAGRTIELTAGSLLLRVPKGSGGATVHSAAVSVAITGTTIILENLRGGGTRLTVLEGAARLSLNRDPGQRRDVAGGQMLEVARGATRLGQPQKADLARTMKTSPLVAGFRPLPSQNLINNVMQQQQQQQAGQPPRQPGGPNAPGGPNVGGPMQGPAGGGPGHP